MPCKKYKKSKKKKTYLKKRKEKKLKKFLKIRKEVNND